jgi:LuxR family transcriptional regulator, maltose regulon positive regulatory protein
MQEEIRNYQLTQKEYQILPLIYEGLSRKEMAQKLEINQRTLDSRVDKILKIVGVKNRVQLIALLARNLVSFDVIETRTSRLNRKSKNLGEG